MFLKAKTGLEMKGYYSLDKVTSICELAPGVYNVSFNDNSEDLQVFEGELSIEAQIDAYNDSKEGLIRQILNINPDELGSFVSGLKDIPGIGK